LTTIGDGFAYSCTKLTEINLSGLTSLTTIGNNFADNCTSLKNIIIPQKLITIFKEFENIKEFKNKIQQDSSSKKKYLKYKNKYLLLKKLIANSMS
jgi:hypothetical protein